MSDDEVTADGKTYAATERKAADRGDDRLFHEADGAHHPGRFRLVRAHFRDVHHRQLLQVAAGAETGSGRGKDDRPDTLVTIELGEGVTEGAHQFGTERISPVRAVDGQDRNFALLPAI